MLNHHTHPTDPIRDKKTIPFDTSMDSSSRQHVCLRVEFLLKTDSGYPRDAEVTLRVGVLLKTDSGYPRDAEVTLFTLANPEHSLRFNTHWSAPTVSDLDHSGGPRKMSQSPVSRNSNIERRMDRPRAVVGVIRGVA